MGSILLCKNSVFAMTLIIIVIIIFDNSVKVDDEFMLLTPDTVRDGIVFSLSCSSVRQVRYCCHNIS